MVLGYADRRELGRERRARPLLFDWFQYYGDTRRLWRDFSRNYRDLIRSTGLKAFHA